MGRIEFRTGPISKIQLSDQQFSDNINTASLFGRAIRTNIICPPVDMTEEQTFLWDAHIEFYSVRRGGIHYIPYPAAGKHCVRSVS